MVLLKMRQEIFTYLQMQLLILILTVSPEVQSGHYTIIIEILQYGQSRSLYRVINVTNHMINGNSIIMVLFGIDLCRRIPVLCRIVIFF
jgi:hypothetical protein